MDFMSFAPLVALHFGLQVFNDFPGGHFILAPGLLQLDDDGVSAPVEKVVIPSFF